MGRRRLLRGPLEAAALVVLGLLVVSALLGPLLSSRDPLEQTLSSRLEPPSNAY